MKVGDRVEVVHPRIGNPNTGRLVRIQDGDYWVEMDWPGIENLRIKTLRFSRDELYLAPPISMWIIWLGVLIFILILAWKKGVL